MYNVVIADDESIIREGIAGMVPWENLGFSLAAMAENGVDALHKAKIHQPDLIITDIRMPQMDGLDLIKKIRRVLPDCKIIILSGHGEFEYAKRALQLGVTDFLLKPIDFVILYEVLEKVKQELCRQLSEKNQMNLLKHQVEEEKKRKQQMVLRRYIERKASWQEVLKELPKIKDSVGYCAGILIQVDNFDHLTSSMNEEGIFTFTQELEQRLLDQAGADTYVIENDPSRYFILFFGEQKEEMLFQIKLYIHKLRGAKLRVEFTTITSSLVDGPSACRRCLEQVKSCMDRTFLLGPAQDLCAEDAPADIPVSLPSEIDMRSLIQVISEFRIDKIQGSLDEITSHIRKTANHSYLYTSMLVSFVYGEAMKLLAEMHCPIQSILADPMKEYHKIMACQSLDRMMEQLMVVLKRICLFLEENAGASQDTVEYAKTYIKEHYSNAKLSLDMVASAAGISPTYLSALFKQNAGKSFVSYLTETRLSHARRLLQGGDYRSYEVAYMCGYDNPTYFSTIFKRYAGISPSAYRKQCEPIKCEMNS